MKRFLPLLLPLLLLLPACSDQETSVTVSLRPEAGMMAESKTVSCPAMTPLEEEVCRQLFQISNQSFEPVAPMTPCTQIYGGPEELEISGVLRGRPVRARYWRNDGCELQRWQEVAPLARLLFGPPAGN